MPFSVDFIYICKHEFLMTYYVRGCFFVIHIYSSNKNTSQKNTLQG